MTIKVCSGWHPEGSIQYGRDFLASFDRFWPKDVLLEVYTEVPEAMPRDACRNLWAIEGARNCEAFFGPARYHGRVPDPTWKATSLARGYNFKFDAAKFWKQILIPQAAAQGMQDGDILVWLDGDVETIARIPADMVECALDEHDCCYLGRQPKHSEIGFWAVRINAKTRPFLANMAACYTSGAVLTLREWHSAFVWDEARVASEMQDGLRSRNLCRAGASGHVFPQSMLARYLRHDKGDRKMRR